MRYYIKADNAGLAVAVYRLNESPDNFSEELWKPTGWEPTTRLMKYLIDGESSVYQATEEEALAVIEELK